MREAGESKYDFSSTSLLKIRPTNNRSQSGKKRSSDPPRKVSDELSLSVTTEVKVYKLILKIATYYYYYHDNYAE